MLFHHVFILMRAIATSFANQPTLSDPLGLNSADNKYQFEAGYDYVKGDVWPKPQEETRQDTYYSLDPKNFDMKSVGEQSDVLVEALRRYKAITFPDEDIKLDTSKKQMLSLHIDVVLPYTPLALITDESYTLVVGAPHSSLMANTVWGALRGIESFSQVVHQDRNGYYHAQQKKIVDFPRFHHRGFMIDTSRHFINKTFIFQFIDALSYSKFNVLHWHIVDDQSFPYVSTRFPHMSQQGAFTEKSVYTTEDIQQIIEYARLRGVRVLPEFDTPGHVRSWGSIPKLLTPCYSSGKPNGDTGPVNPIVDSNYEFLEEFFKEVANVFPDPYIHLGGDEVYLGCWKSNPDILRFMKEKGWGTNFNLLENYYEQKILDIVAKTGKNYFVWEEVVNNNVKVTPDTVVNIWYGGMDHVARITKLGLRVVYSSCWYLNYIGYGADWEGYYKCDPQDFQGTQEQKDSVIGGTGCMWGEFVDGVNFISTTWARAMSVGGRLWSSKETTDLTEAYLRMWEHRCRYLRRGLNADPIVRSQYCRHEWQND